MVNFKQELCQEWNNINQRDTVVPLTEYLCTRMSGAFGNNSDASEPVRYFSLPPRLFSMNDSFCFEIQIECEVFVTPQ